MTTRTTRTTRPNEAGDDFRVNRYDITHEYRDSFSVYPNEVSAGGSDMSNHPRVVEVQAFRPTTSGMGIADYPVISLGLQAPTGEAMVMLSKAEAEEVARALMFAVHDAGRLEIAAFVEARQPALHDRDLGGDGEDYEDFGPVFDPSGEPTQVTLDILQGR
jgi:hypothetical protein